MHYPELPKVNRQPTATFVSTQLKICYLLFYHSFWPLLIIFNDNEIPVGHMFYEKSFTLCQVSVIIFSLLSKISDDDTNGE